MNKTLNIRVFANPRPPPKSNYVSPLEDIQYVRFYRRAARPASEVENIRHFGSSCAACRSAMPESLEEARP